MLSRNQSVVGLVVPLVYTRIQEAPVSEHFNLSLIQIEDVNKIKYLEVS